MWIHARRGWEIPASEMTPEAVYADRREFLRRAGLGALGWLGASRLLADDARSKVGGAKTAPEKPAGDAAKKNEPKGPYPARRSEKFTLDRPLTGEGPATRFNNFYEFSFGKEAPAHLAQKMVVRPWSLEVTGLCSKPKTFDVDDLVKRMPLEERLYRFRCVEAWAMAVPWTGFPLSKLLDEVEPLSNAKHVRFISFKKAEWAPNQRDEDYPWPYFEGLTMAEARNELALLVTGLYGKPIPNQNGAPIRLIVPWKYGYKSAKSIVRIELVEKKPATFWNEVVPEEYDFVANVNPAVPHPRWSQATERLLETGERRATLPYNGYGEFVAKLYG